MKQGGLLMACCAVAGAVGLASAQGLGQTTGAGQATAPATGQGGQRAGAPPPLAGPIVEVQNMFNRIKGYFTKAADQFPEDKYGWSPTPDQVLYRAVAQVSETETAASPAGGEGIFRPFFHGGPKQVIGQVEQLRAAGVGVIDMAFAAIGHERAMAAVEVLAEGVLPAMHAM